MRLLVIVGMLIGVGCTPKAHRAYQIAMVGLAQVADTHALLQTRAALRMDPTTSESNPFLGERPSDTRLVGAGVVNAGIGGLILALPRNRGPENDWIVDVLATGWAVLTTSWAINDTILTDVRWYR